MTSPSPPRLNHPPAVRSATIVPNPVLLSGPVLVQVEADDPDNDPVTFRHQWLANGSPIDGATSSVLVPRMLKRGDQLAVEVIPLDGKGEGAPYRVETVVGNTPPEVTRVVFEPDQVRIGDRLHAKVEGLDADQDPIRYTYKWWRNTLPVAEGDQNTLDTTGFARDDTIVVEATPHDAAGRGKPKYSEPITIGNSPPTITSVPPTTVTKGRYEYAVTAVDPDGDRLTYTLDAAPPGMTIEKTTGRIEWQLTIETRGTHRVRVTVQDDRKGFAFQEFELGVPSPS